MQPNSSPSSQLLAAAAPESAAAADRIRAFADAHYDALAAAVSSKNSGHFHQCCFAFSTRGKSGRLGHPKTSSQLVSGLFKRKGVDSKERFVEVLREIALELPPHLQHCQPLLNAKHWEPQLPVRPKPVSKELRYRMHLQKLKRRNMSLAMEILDQNSWYEIACDELAKQTEAVAKYEFFLKFNYIDPSHVVTEARPTDDPQYKPTTRWIRYPEFLPSYPTPPLEELHWHYVRERIGDGEVKSEKEMKDCIKYLDELWAKPPADEPK